MIGTSYSTPNQGENLVHFEFLTSNSTKVFKTKLIFIFRFKPFAFVCLFIAELVIFRFFVNYPLTLKITLSVLIPQKVLVVSPIIYLSKSPFLKDKNIAYQFEFDSSSTIYMR